MRFNTDYIINRTLINYCAPVLLGRKPSALFTLASIQCLRCLKKATQRLLTVKVLRKQKNSILVLVYKPELLETLVLKDEKVRNMLLLHGYPLSFSVATYLSYLEYRFSGNNDFPHEIGLFLGYPAEDVLGFIKNGGMEYKCCGTWKVYGDEESSKRRFDEYKYCGECLRTHLEKGGTLKNFNIEIKKTGGFYE